MMAFFPIIAQGAKESPDLRSLRLEYIQQYIEDAAAKEKLDPLLLRAIIRVESNFNHDAVSRVGARGLMQIMPATALDLGKEKALDKRNPRANVFAGASYIRKMIILFEGDTKLAIAAYNAGPTAVKKYKGVPPYRETQSYVKKVMKEWDKEKASAFASSSK
ncbi:MAG: lytic transglycosylase domain-containing protein [Oligoflexia bacterium]|nr:lytic transglycosylase domain-containing protein [Oligoflexia bacterium]